MPDYEIRLYRSDGNLAIVHMSCHESDGEALAHARSIMGDNTRFEIRQGGREIAAAR